MHHTTDRKLKLWIGAIILSCLILAIVLGLCSCATLPPSTYNDRPCDPGTTLTGRLCQDVDSLSGLVPPRRAANMTSLNRAANYIAREFEKTGCRMEEQHFSVEEGTDYRNIICSFGPVDGERIIVGAHYDVSPGQGARPGADDNASGVAGILEIARIVSKEKPALARPLNIIAYTLEEEPYFSRRTDMGSFHHAESLFKKKVSVRLMMSLEMIGYFSDKPDSQTYPLCLLYFSYPSKGNYIAVVGKAGQDSEVLRVRDLMAKQITIEVQSITASGGVDLSDHRNYWAFGYPAVMITDTADYRNPNYHEASDTRQTLDFTSMAEVVKGVYKVILDY
jgi:hypothetical protein